MLRLARFFRTNLSAGQARVRTGQSGEQLAARFLRRKGMRIVTRNWRSGRLELDLVCREDAVLVFVEVRTRSAAAKVPGFHSLTRAKKEALKRARLAYLQALRNKPAAYRFDLVEVTRASDGSHRLEHYESIDL
ncbi:MAG: YraN family protein [Opitutales bacterium]